MQQRWWQTPAAKAVLSGILLALSFPPMPAGFVAYFGLIPFFYAIHQTDGSSGFRLGYIAGLFYCGGAAYWIGANSGTYIWAAVLSAVLASAIIALNFALFGFLLGFIIKRRLPGAFWWAAPFWLMSEYLRSFGQLIFPWLNLSLSQSHYLPLIQPASLFGMYGISFWVVLVNLAIFGYLEAKRSRRPLLRPVLTVFLIYSIPLLYGIIVLEIPHPPKDRSKVFKVGVLQPDVDPNQKWSESFRQKNFALLDSLTIATVVAGDPDIVIWPETAVPSYIRYNRHGFKTQLQALVQTIARPVLTGTPDWEPDTTESGQKSGSDHQGFYYNSALLFAPNRPATQNYRKVKLVPFGEYIPYSKLFGFINGLDLGQGYFTPGKKYTVFRDYREQGVPDFSVAICYDSSFPRLIRHFRRNGAQWLAIITNDAWFGNTSGPYQHAQWAKIRAVENRMPVARSANTGVSMLIDPWGRVKTRLPFNSRGILTGRLNAFPPMSLYDRIGDLFSIIVSIIGGAGFIWAMVRK